MVGKLKGIDMNASFWSVRLILLILFRPGLRLFTSFQIGEALVSVKEHRCMAPISHLWRNFSSGVPLFRIGVVWIPGYVV